MHKVLRSCLLSRCLSILSRHPHVVCEPAVHECAVLHFAGRGTEFALLKGPAHVTQLRWHGKDLNLSL